MEAILDSQLGWDLVSPPNRRDEECGLAAATASLGLRLSRFLHLVKMIFEMGWSQQISFVAAGVGRVDFVSGVLLSVKT